MIHEVPLHYKVTYDKYLIITIYGDMDRFNKNLSMIIARDSDYGLFKDTETILKREENRFIVDKCSGQAMEEMQRIFLASEERIIIKDSYRNLEAKEPPYQPAEWNFYYCPGEHMGGCGIGVNLSPHIAELLKTQKPVSTHSIDHPIVKAMYDHWIRGISKYRKDDESREFSDKDLYRHSFRFSITDTPGVHFSVPGDACGLDTDYYSGWRNSLSPHNNDTPIQSMTLGVGLAVFLEMLDKSSFE